jgi:CheY-like chemotaxis protein
LHAAIEALADALWVKYGLSPESADIAHVHTPSVDSELSWLRANLGESSNLRDAIERAFELSQGYASEFSVRLIADVPMELPHIAAHPVALSQMLLNVLTVAIARAACGSVSVSVDVTAAAVRDDVAIRVFAERQCGEPMFPDEAASLDLTQQLARLSKGALRVGPPDAECFEAVLSLPALEQRVVLIVDDNADTLQLLERYAAGTPYNVLTTRDPERVIEMAEKHAPHVVVLDVMMPQVDGWMLLGRLRHHPVTQDTPIVVCTILAQEKLALSLGANGVLKKPVSRQDFLAALDLACAQA